MKLEILETAILEARRFLDTARIAREEILNNMAEPGKWLKDTKHPCKTGNKRQAACKRASMDLSRILSELRKY